MRVSGRLRVPGDKSISHRALLCAALAEGRSRIEGILDSADIRSTAGVLRELGVDVPPLTGSMDVRGVGLHGLRAPPRPLDCGNSGTTARLMSGVLAASPFTSRLIGDESLSRRPMRRVTRPLEAMGARVTFERGEGLPLEITGGPLRPIGWESEAASAQVKGAILFAALVAGVVAEVREPARSRTHSERMLAARGVPVSAEGTIVRLTPVSRLDAVDMVVPGDPSSAAFFAGLAALADDGELTLEGVGADETRTGFFRALSRMGARVTTERTRTEGGESVADFRVAPGSLRAIDVTPEEVPSMIDELPLIACLGARAEGTTTIRGAAELRVKESDRIAAVAANLRGLGVPVEELPDGMTVTGTAHALRGRVVTHGDHRLAMAFAVIGALPGSDLTIDDPDCVSVSYPGFWSDLASAQRL